MGEAGVIGHGRIDEHLLELLAKLFSRLLGLD